MAERPPRDPNKMTLMQHLEELRRRLVWSLVVVGIAVVACFSIAPQLFDWLRRPLDKLIEHNDIVLQVLGPMEMFMTYLKLSFLAALCFSAPWVLIQLWLFVA